MKTRAKQILFSPLTLDVLLMALLGFWGWHFFRPLENVVNIELFDETGYLSQALQLPIWRYPPEYAPLYRLWYRVLAMFQPDPLRLYYLSYRWVAILVPLAIYWALRRAKVTPAMAFWAGALALVARGESLVWPRVSIFWALVFALALGILWPYMEKAPWWLVFAYSAWVLWWAAFVRPSMTLPALAFGAIAVVIGAFTRFPHRRRAHLWLLATALVPLLLWGLPYQQDRLLIAFRQHFIVVRSELGDPIENPWFATKRIVEYFPNTDSLWAMLRDRPDLMAEHARYNLSRFPVHFAEVSQLPTKVLDAHHIGFKGQILFFFGIPSLWGIIEWIISLRNSASRKKFLLNWLRLFLPLSPVIGVTGIIAMLIVPHMHYLYMLWTALLLGYAITFGRRISKAPKFSRVWHNWAEYALLFTILGMSLWSWRDFDMHGWARFLKDPDHTVQRVAQFVRGLNLPTSQTIYTMGTMGQWETYFGPQFRGVDNEFRFGDTTDLKAFVENRPVGLFVMTSPNTLPCTAHPDTPQACQDLLAHPETWGFTKYTLTMPSGNEITILVRSSLLPNPP